MAIPEFALFFWSFPKGRESFSFLLPLVENLLMSQLDGGSRVLGGLESKERIMGGEKASQAFAHGLQSVLGSSLGCHHSAKSIQKTASRLYAKRPGPDTSWLFL